MNIKKFFLIFIFSYSAVLLRHSIGDIFVVSYLASFTYGFALTKSINNDFRDILFCGFCSSLSTFSGFVSLFNTSLAHGQFFQTFFLINYLIFLNIFIMYLGFLLGKKLNKEI